MCGQGGLALESFDQAGLAIDQRAINFVPSPGLWLPFAVLCKVFETTASRHDTCELAAHSLSNILHPGSLMLGPKTS